ncbi:MAG: YbhB/YbcL family Raf kinase inhibitor-like protein [Deltaproteobacteria bacterium]|nr:YbhB/YbcL family Raf kinase inhibitor-like protein [Deltaproteobacteria bacterium]
MSFTMTSTAVTPEAAIPKAHTGEGIDRSPPLAWSGAPAGTKYFALVCEDPDAPVGNWVHWTLYDLPAQVTSLAEGVGKNPSLPSGARQGKNSWGELGYRGPMPPKGHGRHRYYFRLYALSAPTGLPSGASREELARALEGKVLGRAELMGTYQR